MKSLFIPGDAKGDVEALLRLTDEQVRHLDRILGDKGSLKADKRTYRRVAEALEVSPEEALGILSAVDNLRRQREQFDVSDAGLIDDLSTIHPVEQAAREGLLELLRKSEEDYFVEKVATLRHSLTPYATDLRTIVDARPVFTKDRDKVEGLLFVTYLEVTCHDPNTDRIRTNVIQFDRKRLKKLKEAIDDAEKKLDKLATTLGGFDVYE